MGSWRTRALFAVWIVLAASIIKLFGNHYVQPLPIWLRIVIAAVCVGAIAAAAIYSRRHAGRPTAER
jgi:hypothetical protein